MQDLYPLDEIDKSILRALVDDGRASYSEIAKMVGVSVSTARNRIQNLRDSKVLFLNVWLDTYRVGLGVTATFMIDVHPGSLEEVKRQVLALDETGYVAVIVGDHDLTADGFFRDVPHLHDVVTEGLQKIDGVAKITTYLVTEIAQDSSSNIGPLLANPEC